MQLVKEATFPRAVIELDGLRLPRLGLAEEGAGLPGTLVKRLLDPVGSRSLIRRYHCTMGVVDHTRQLRHILPHHVGVDDVVSDLRPHHAEPPPDARINERIVLCRNRTLGLTASADGRSIILVASREEVRKQLLQALERPVRAPLAEVKRRRRRRRRRLDVHPLPPWLGRIPPSPLNLNQPIPSVVGTPWQSPPAARRTSRR